MPEVRKKRAIIAETIRKLTEEQRMGEVVSWPKISFLPTEPDILRGSQLWETWEEEDSRVELKATKAMHAVEVTPLPETKSKPSVVPRLKKGPTSEWDFPDFVDDIGAPEENIGKGSRGRGKGFREGLNKGMEGGRRGVKGIVEVSRKQSGDGSFDTLRKESIGDDSFDAMRKASVKKKDCLFDNIQFSNYDRQADKRYESAKSFRNPKKTPTSHSAATAAVRGILSEMDSVTNEISGEEENSLIGENNYSMEVEVTDVEVIVME